jgi:hypothetical protein
MAFEPQPDMLVVELLEPVERYRRSAHINVIESSCLRDRVRSDGASSHGPLVLEMLELR